VKWRICFGVMDRRGGDSSGDVLEQAGSDAKILAFVLLCDGHFYRALV
jgi:hypothetical protein